MAWSAGSLLLAIALASPAPSAANVTPPPLSRFAQAPPATQDGEWIPLAIPSTRAAHSATRDPVRDRIIVIGGADDSNILGETWALSLTTSPAWTRLQPEGALPSPRFAHTAIYDPVRDRLVVFGGYTFDGTYHPVNDTWELSLGATPAWTPLAPTGAPPSARFYHTAIYDPVRDRMIVFGGRNPTDSTYNDVWALSLADPPAWTELAPTGTPPGERASASAIYDPVRDRMIVFGGGDARAWELSLAGTPAWTELAPTGTPPETRSAHTAVYDSGDDRMIVFGGDDGLGHSLGDSWALSLAGTPAWTPLSPVGTSPGLRAFHAAVYDPAGDRMVVFGGSQSNHTVNDVWLLSLDATPTWTVPITGATPPNVRSAHSFVYDPVRDRFLVFGGTSGNTAAEHYNDVWALTWGETATWEFIDVAGTPPTPRDSHSAIYDPVRDRILVFGGENSALGSLYNDVWALSLAGTPTWTEITPAGTPPSLRIGHSAIYDPTGDRMVVFGGIGFGGYMNDVWALSLSGTPTWSEIKCPEPLPNVRVGHSAIHDPQTNRMIVYGGSGSGSNLGDVWALRLTGPPGWTQLAPSGGSPGLRVGHTGIYDSVRKRMVVFGGVGANSYRNDVWVLALIGGLAWTQLAPAGTLPSPEVQHAAAYDPIKNRMVVFGGLGEAQHYNNDVWALDWDGLTPALVSLFAAEPTADGIVLRWQFGDPSGIEDSWVERADHERGPWVRVAGDVVLDGDVSTLLDAGVEPSLLYSYRLAVQFADGQVLRFGPIAATAGTTLEHFSVVRVAPNPASGPVRVDFTVPRPAHVRITVHDLQGRRVAALLDADLPVGVHQAVWSAETAHGPAKPGVYLVRCEAGGQRFVRRIVVTH